MRNDEPQRLSAGGGERDDRPALDRVARDARTQRLGLVLEIDADGDRVRLQDLTTGLPWWAGAAAVRRVPRREESSLRLAVVRARELGRRWAAVENGGQR